MFSNRWAACVRSVVVCLSVAGLMSACSPSNYPFFQPQSGFRHQASAITHPSVAPADTLPNTAPAIPSALPVSPQTRAETETPVGRLTEVPASVGSPKPRISPVLSRNPDVPQRPRSPVFSWGETESVQYVAKKLTPAERKAYNKTRRVPTLNWLALAGSLVPYGILILSLTSGFAWVAGMVFSLGSVLAGIAGLTKISRNPEKYRGKGWAISAILLATGFMGVALLALAALSTSRVIWE
ncbi:hypothetical protein GCM10023187_08620 [Nibrella viscosa]|uniref:DUF4190 domain-containing protein n=1 Tax=Nibrella viscosa TaxID=1084524 RepID=A0ABP8JZ43_9BACT